MLLKSQRLTFYCRTHQFKFSPTDVVREPVHHMFLTVMSLEMHACMCLRMSGMAYWFAYVTTPLIGALAFVDTCVLGLNPER